MVIGSGTTPTHIDARKGIRLMYWVDGTVVKGKHFDMSNNVLKEDFTAIDTVDEGFGIAVDEIYAEHGSKWRVEMLVYKDGEITTYISENGITFVTI